MVAYIHKQKGGYYELTLVGRPCSGAEFQAGKKIKVSGKREANAICKECGATPYNF